jgi:hypothetical protein
MVVYLDEARIRNFQKWPIIGVYVNWNGFVGNTYQEDVNFLKTYIANRAAWIDNNLPGICDLSIQESAFEPEYFKVWPNPFDGMGYVGFTLTDLGQMELELIDNTGRIMYKNDLGSFEKGEHAVPIQIDNLSSGTYIFLLKKDGSIFGKGKIIKK